jgi:HSP20 family molecular chaperone IbpA
MTTQITQNYTNPHYTVGHYSNTTDRVLRQLPALFNDSWLDGVFEHFDRAFDVPNAVYPYNVIVSKDENDEPLQYVIEVALAGVGKQNIDVKVRDNRLHIVVDKQTEETEATYVKRGISKRTGQLSFTLSENTNVKKITSVYTDGMLRVTVPVIRPEVVNVDIKVD